MEGKPNMALMYPKSYAECRDSVFDGQWILALSAKIDDEFG